MTELDTPLSSLGAMTHQMVGSEAIRSAESHLNRHSRLHYQHHPQLSHLEPRESRRASIDCGSLKIGSKPSVGSLGVSPEEHIGKGLPMTTTATTTTTAGKSTHRRPSHKTGGHPRPVLLHHFPKSSLYTPIPPSLLTSPLLNSPESPFFARSVCSSSNSSSSYTSIPISSIPFSASSSAATPPPTPSTASFQFPPISFLPPFANTQQQLVFCSAHPPSPPISNDHSGQRRYSTEFIWSSSSAASQTEPSEPSGRGRSHSSSPGPSDGRNYSSGPAFIKSRA